MSNGSGAIIVIPTRPYALLRIPMGMASLIKQMVLISQVVRAHK